MRDGYPLTGGIFVYELVLESSKRDLRLHVRLHSDPLPLHVLSHRSPIWSLLPDTILNCRRAQPPVFPVGAMRNGSTSVYGAARAATLSRLRASGVTVSAFSSSSVRKRRGSKDLRI